MMQYVSSGSSTTLGNPLIQENQATKRETVTMSSAARRAAKVRRTEDILFEIFAEPLSC